MKKNDRFRFLGPGLKTMLPDLIPDQSFALVMLRKDWERVVGRAIAAHSYPQSIGMKTLLVLVDDPIWLSELSLQKDDILTRTLNYVQRQRPVAIESVRFRLGTLPSKEEEMTEKQSLRLPEGQMEKIEALVKGVEDPDLRTALRHYFIQISLENVPGDKEP